MKYDKCPVCGSELLSEKNDYESWACNNCGYFSNEKLEFNTPSLSTSIEKLPQSIIDLQFFDEELNYVWLPSIVMTTKYNIVPIESDEGFWHVIKVEDDKTLSEEVISFGKFEFKKALDKLESLYS